MADDLQRRRQVAEEATRAAGAIHLKHLSSTIDYEAKTDPRDVLTKADLEAQEVAKSILSAAFPDDVLIGEEDGIPTSDLLQLFEDGCWLIDPLDGTQSYVHAFPAFTAGIAYVKGGVSQAGAIYDAVQDDMWSAARGHGASWDGQPIRVTPGKPLKECMVGLHIREVENGAAEIFLRTTGNVLMKSHGIRILGCPMLSMAYIACGRFDAFAMLSPAKLGPWDLAPAAVVLEEAGGVVAEGVTGGPLRWTDRAIAGATTKTLLEELYTVARGEA
ncbi:MAG TPA: inositol monophosphatase family protein [Dehalococcoidia bacterium]|jgi:myo-inositol-1(or 4)-monophosphatase|nr:inositol monophosphatase family protein [Dehalococcoidia bacterium]